VLYAICNPTAGHGRGKTVGNMVEKRLMEKGIPFHMVYTTHPGHAAQLAKEAQEQGAQTVLAIGGDGTAFETAQGLIHTDTALGIIPAGTGNDFIKTIGVPAKPLDALDHILSHGPQKTDVGLINDRMFLNEIGAGFDVAVLDYTQQVKRFARGILPYFYGVIRALFSFRAMDIKYTVDGGDEICQKAFVVGVANGGRIGGGILIAPDARVDDGMLDVIIVGDIKKRHLPSRLLGLMRGKILTFPETKFCRARSVSFSSEGMRLNIDGEVMNAQQAETKILPGALMIHR